MITKSESREINRIILTICKKENKHNICIMPFFSKNNKTKFFMVNMIFD